MFAKVIKNVRVPVFTTRSVFTAPSLCLRLAQNGSKTTIPTFSLRTRFLSDKALALNEAIKTEIDGEKDNKIELDNDYLEIKAKILKTFKVKDEPGLGTVTLTSTKNNQTISITFDCQDEEEIEPDFDEEEEEEGEDEDNDGEEDTPENEANTGINFEVKIVKPSGVVLIAEGLASDELRINSIRFVPAGVDHENTDLYAGPDFSTLDDNVQAAFVDYFKDLQIDDDLSYFIISYSREKEQKEYFNWLKKLEEFTSK